VVPLSDHFKRVREGTQPQTLPNCQILLSRGVAGNYGTSRSRPEDSTVVPGHHFSLVLSGPDVMMRTVQGDVGECFLDRDKGAQS
jgi:hypothetical protein